MALDEQFAVKVAGMIPYYDATLSLPTGKRSSDFNADKPRIIQINCEEDQDENIAN
ncbi:hypothetical protein KIN20_001466 [Parelaphostrongylus tenuis]|uniref:Uncharacterized protein n=1 Tax=Parelaphostrongylus tenuis TaxID=148309 RepID=A0AAD5LW66_PARTN|nr:hypothetical protein KIN20_001466 [Parelaphostrongylus tenuis]